jgi:hypothetical protein
MTKLTVVFNSFQNAPKNELCEQKRFSVLKMVVHKITSKITKINLYSNNNHEVVTLYS